MKKIVVLFLIVSLIIGFADCKPTGENETINVHSPNVETTITNYEPEKEKVSYKKIDVNLYGGYVTAFGFSDFSPDRMYVALRGGEIYRTDVLGLSWQKIAKIPFSSVKSYSCQTDNEIGAIAEASDGKTLFILTRSGLFKSIDSGKTFEYCSNGFLTVTYANLIEFSKKNPDHIFVSGPNDSYISVDGGSTWNVITGVGSLCFDRVNDVFYGASENYIFKSTDFGKTWQKIDKQIKDVQSIVISESTPSTICIVTYGKMIFTSDDFRDFKEVPFNFTNMYKIAINPKDPKFVVAAPVYAKSSEQIKLCVSEDGGEHFKQIGIFNGIDDAKFSPDGSKFLLLTYGGTLYSTKDGTTFKCENVFPEVTFNKIVDVGSKMFALTNSGVFEWNKETNKLTLLEKEGLDRNIDLAYCYTKPDNVYVLSTVSLYKLEESKLKKVSDCYSGWALYVDPIDPQNLTVGRASDGSSWLSVSNDGGKTFKYVNEDSGPSIPFNPSIPAIAFDPTNPSTIFAVGSDSSIFPKVFKSVDGGKTFTKVSDTNNGLIRVPALICVDSSTLYAYDTGVYDSYRVSKSVDGGKTFVPINNGLPPVSIKDLKFNPKTGDLFLLTQSYGIFTLKKGSSNWLDISGDLPKDKITAIEIDANTGDVFVGVDGSGIYSLKP